MATRIYKTPFAATGDKEALATADQPDGKVSLQAGWTPDYELPNDNANYRPVGRGEMNGVLNEVTEGLGEIQLNGFAKWQPIDGGWPLGSYVLHNAVVYRSTTDNNTSDPDAGGAGWINPLSGRLLGITTYTTAGTFTFTPSPLAKSWRVIVTGAGGGSGGVNTTGAGESKASTGGGGGGTTIHNYTTAFTSASVVVGAGGAGGTAAPTNGGNGAISSFSPVGGIAISATGGSGSPGVSLAAFLPSQQAGASGGVGAGGNLFPNIVGGNGGNAQFPRTSNGISGSGGSSYWSPGGAAVAGLNAAGNIGRFGSGAGGCIAQEAGNFQNGAAGGAGVVYIEEYA